MSIDDFMRACPYADTGWLCLPKCGQCGQLFVPWGRNTDPKLSNCINSTEGLNVVLRLWATNFFEGLKRWKVLVPGAGIEPARLAAGDFEEKRSAKSYTFSVS